MVLDLELDIIKQSLLDISENDILIYCDAGCKINLKGKKRFDEYIDLLKIQMNVLFISNASYRKNLDYKRNF